MPWRDVKPKENVFCLLLIICGGRGFQSEKGSLLNIPMFLNQIISHLNLLGLFGGDGDHIFRYALTH